MCQPVHCCANVVGVEPFKNVFQLSQCAPLPQAHVENTGTMLVKENKCKLGGKYLFAIRNKQRKWGNQPVQ